MNRKAIIQKFREEGILNGAGYYLGRLLSEIEMRTIGPVTARFASVCPTRIVLKNRMMMDYSDNTRALYEYLVKNGYTEKYQIIWVVSEKKRFRNYKQKNVRFVTAENRYGWNSPLAYYYGATAKYFFFTHYNADLNRFHCPGQITVNLWHGCGYKGAGIQKKELFRSTASDRFDYALVPGPLFAEAKKDFWHCPVEKILPLGYPRYDWMMNPGKSRKEIMTLLFQWEGRGKTVIWLPTFRQSKIIAYQEGEIEFSCSLPGIESEEELKQLNEELKKREMLLIIKKHPLQSVWNRSRDDSNIRFLSEEKLDRADIRLYQLLGVCDALLTDYSSAAVDFMLLDRPIGFVLSDYAQYKEKRGFVFEDPLQYMPGEKLYDYKDIAAFLGHVAEEKDLFREERRGLMPAMHQVTDCYCRRIADRFGIK